MGNANNEGADRSKMALVAVCRLVNLELDHMAVVAVVLFIGLDWIQWDIGYR
jgi:hypothetical protein